MIFWGKNTRVFVPPFLFNGATTNVRRSGGNQCRRTALQRWQVGDAGAAQTDGRQRGASRRSSSVGSLVRRHRLFAVDSESGSSSALAWPGCAPHSPARLCRASAVPACLSRRLRLALSRRSISPLSATVCPCDFDELATAPEASSCPSPSPSGSAPT
jgi:hypothetical protein